MTVPKALDLRYITTLRSTTHVSIVVGSMHVVHQNLQKITCRESRALVVYITSEGASQLASPSIWLWVKKGYLKNPIGKSNHRLQ